MKIVAVSEQQKEKILRNAKNLRSLQDYKAVFIHQDLTVKQTRKRQQLVAQLKQRKDQGEQDLIIVNDRIVARRKSQKLT